MKSSLLALILIFSQYLALGQSMPQLVEESDLVIGKSLTITSDILQEERALNIYLPHGYKADSLKTYPVIYLLDGAMDEDFIHIAGLVQFGSFPWINIVPESIIVGITNTNRKRDFTYPSNNALDQKEFPESGESARFIQFIANELQPFIQANFSISEEKTIIGQSLGGLLATEILFKQPELFDRYIIVSPSLWWDDEKLLAYSPEDHNSQKQIYLAVGKEGEVMERTARALYQKLKTLNWKNSTLFFEFLEDKTHGDALHMAVYHAFEQFPH